MLIHLVSFYDTSKIYRASFGFLGVSQGLWEVLGDPLGVLGRPSVVRGVLCGSLGVLLAALRVPLGYPQGGAERAREHSGSLGVSGEGSWVLGVILVVWGDSYVQPRMCEC